MTIRFWMDDEHLSTAKAVGSLPVAEDVPFCALQLGDTISFPGFRGLAFEVIGRHYRNGAAPGQQEWLLKLQPVPHPTGP